VVIPPFVTVTVVKESVTIDVPAEVVLGTATITVAVPPGVDGGLVTVFGAVSPSFVTVIVVKPPIDGI
jgi:hypothetical protein